MSYITLLLEIKAADAHRFLYYILYSTKLPHFMEKKPVCRIKMYWYIFRQMASLAARAFTKDELNFRYPQAFFAYSTWFRVEPELKE